MFLRKLESAENGGQKMSNMFPVLLIDTMPLTSSELKLNELNAELLAERTMRDAYGQLADQILSCLWERRELEAINLLVICRPFFRRFKVSRPDFSMAEADLREDVTHSWSLICSTREHTSERRMVSGHSTIQC